MSPNINSFVGDLVEMARAMEELPEAKKAIAELTMDNEALRDAIQQKELRIIDLKNSIDEKLSTIRALEVARDDAELRFLELDEKASKVLGVLNSIVVDAKSAEGVLNPPMPYPASEPVAEKLVEAQAVTEGAGESHPTASVDTKLENVGSGTQAETAFSGDPSNVDSWASAPGQSEADPTVSMDITSQSSSAQPTVANESAVVVEETAKPGRYSGKRYYDWATYISLNQWLAEGGTEEDYNWRPSGLAKASPSNY